MSLTDKDDQQFLIERIYVKDASFESPATPQIFTQEWQPKIALELETKTASLDTENRYEVVLSITVTANTKDDTPIYLVETQQAGIFLLKGFSQSMIERMTATVCANILFPFSREIIANLISRGGFPTFLVAPINFEWLYQENLAKQSSGKATKTKH